MDNASANDVLACTLARLLLQRYGIKFETKNAQIRCLAHVVNLVVQKILSALDEAEDPTDEDYYVLNKFMDFHYDPADDEELQDLEAPGAAEADELLCDNPDMPGLEDDDDDNDEYLGGDESDGEEMEEDEDAPEVVVDEPAKGGSRRKGKKKKPKKLTVVEKVGHLLLNVYVSNVLIQQLRTIVRKIVSSPQRRTIFQRHAHKYYEGKVLDDGKTDIAGLMPIRDVRTRWNWMHAMIHRAIILRKVSAGYLP